MVKEKKALLMVANSGPRQKERIRATDIDWSAPPTVDLVATLPKPEIKSKHHVVLEFVENKDKKKKLEFQVVTNRTPPPGFDFVPIGNPALTNACKEISREQDALVFIVSTSRNADESKLGVHLNRIGHHIRQNIVEKAQESLGQSSDGAANPLGPDAPEPIPRSQQQINAQADAVIRDLFPRIPNTDRQQIIDHAFKKGATFKGESVVGMASDLSLSRRVQLAVLAHIRHNHTRYDQLLRETTYENARKLVEPICLDKLVKWRGDDETGRDQLEEILREVVVISDSEDADEDSDDDNDDDDEDVDSPPANAEPKPVGPGKAPSQARVPPSGPKYDKRPKPKSRKQDAQAASKGVQKSKKKRKAERLANRAHRGVFRYKAAWDQAINRHREEQQPQRNQGPHQPPHMDRNLDFGSQQHNDFAFNFHQPVPRSPPRDTMPAQSGGYDPREPFLSTGYDGQELVAGNGNARPPYAQDGYHSHVASREQSIAMSRSWTQPEGSEPQSRKHPLEDMLVRSIEPPSPDYPPQQQPLQSRPPDNYREERVVFRSTDNPHFVPSLRYPSPGREAESSYKRRRLMDEGSEFSGLSSGYEVIRSGPFGRSREPTVSSSSQFSREPYMAVAHSEAYQPLSHSRPTEYPMLRDEIYPSLERSRVTVLEDRGFHGEQAVLRPTVQTVVERPMDAYPYYRYSERADSRPPVRDSYRSADSLRAVHLDDHSQHRHPGPVEFITLSGPAHTPHHEYITDSRPIYIGPGRARAVSTGPGPLAVSDNIRQMEHLSVGPLRHEDPGFIRLHEQVIHPPVHHQVDDGYGVQQRPTVSHYTDEAYVEHPSEWVPHGGGHHPDMYSQREIRVVERVVPPPEAYYQGQQPPQQPRRDDVIYFG